MMIVGSRTNRQRLALRFARCSVCGSATAHQVLEERRWRTLLLVPVGHATRARLTCCTHCGAELPVPFDESQRLAYGGEPSDAVA